MREAAQRILRCRYVEPPGLGHGGPLLAADKVNPILANFLDWATPELPLAPPAREMDGDVGGKLDALRQDLPDPAIYPLLLRGRQGEIGRDG